MYTWLYLPGEDDEEVETIPRVAQVGELPEKSHGRDLDEHLDGEESVDEMVEALEDLAARRGALFVVAWLVHAERDAVQHYHSHTDPLKPRTARVKKTIRSPWHKTYFS